MNADGMFETRKEIYEALLRGKTIVSDLSNTRMCYSVEQDKILREINGNGFIDTLRTFPDFPIPESWSILKPKKRRVIKDYKKLAQALLDHGYVTKDGHFENQWLFRFLGKEVHRSHAKLISADSPRVQYSFYDRETVFTITEEMTEEYEDDE